MSLIARMKQHFADFGAQHVEVPEWGEEGKPLVIYYTPMTLAEKQKLLNARDQHGAILQLVEALVMKASDAQGKKLFTIEDKQALRNLVDPDVLARVVRQMMTSPTKEEMGNGSPETSSSG